MEATNHWHERSTAVRAICSFQESVFYPICFALLCFVSGISPKAVYLPIFGVILVSVLFSALFVKDNKVFLPPLFMLYYALGNEDNTHLLHRGEEVLFEDIDTHLFWVLAVLVTVIIAVRLCADGTLARLSERKGAFFGGIVAMDVAFLLNGFWSETWRPRNLLFGLVMIAGFTVCYLVFFSMLDRASEESSDRSQALISYGCICVVCMAAAVLLQLLWTMRGLHIDGELVKYINGDTVPTLIRDSIRLSWGGYATNIALVIALGIPASMYLARTCRPASLFFVLALVFYGGAALTGTRSCILIGGVTLVSCILLNCFGGRNRKQLRILSLLLLLVSLITFLLIKRHVPSLSQSVSSFLDFLRLDFLKNFDLHAWVTEKDYEIQPRFNLLRTAWDDFRSSPVFGIGFQDGSLNLPADKPTNIGILNHMYHNLPLQFLGSMGLVGLAALVWHTIDLCRIFVRSASIKKTLLLIVPLLILSTSLMDNFFFFLNFQIIYCAFLAFAEHCARPSQCSDSLENT